MGICPTMQAHFLPGSADRGEEAAEGGLSFGGVGEGAGVFQDVREDLAGLPQKDLSSGCGGEDVLSLEPVDPVGMFAMAL